jgi:hypothetical protein
MPHTLYARPAYKSNENGLSSERPFCGSTWGIS